MDKPFTALDALNRRRFREMMKALKREFGIPIIYGIGEALLLADDIMPVAWGRVESKCILTSG